MPNTKLRYRALPLIASPLAQHHKDSEVQSHDHDFGVSSILKSEEVVTVRGAHDKGVPAFREREEASSIELFYDLFFVANLTSFTNVHAIDTTQTVSSYIGFFAILWFTWLQVVIYDVRFGVDSLFERVCKLIHFGVMVTFAIIGNQFDPTAIAENHATFRQLSLVLMVSRVVLICQYCSIIYWVRYHKKMVIPLLIHVAALAVGAIICLGLTFAFSSTSSKRAYIGWYIVVVLEAVIMFVTARIWNGVGFKHTNINERCGLLTLIILGEGIIVLAKSFNYIVKGENFSPAIIGQVISAVLIIYFLYILYFDRVPSPHHHLPPWMHHFWALMHYPFHIALVLFMEGTSRFITWRNALEMVNYVSSEWTLVYDTYSYDPSLLADSYYNFSTNLFYALEADVSKYNITPYLDLLRESTDPDDVYYYADEIWAIFINATFKFFKISASKKAEKTAESTGDKDAYGALFNALQVYDLVFVYFFLAAGLTLVIMAILMVLSKKRMVLGDWLGVALRAVMGIGIALISVVSANIDRQTVFLYSPWMVPCVMLGLLVVVLAEGVLGWVLPAKREQEHGSVEMER